MTEQTEQPSDPRDAEILRLTRDIDGMVEFVAQFGIGEPDFSHVRIEALIKTLIKIGVISEDDYKDLNLRYAQAAARQMYEIVAQLKAAAEEQEKLQVRETLTRGVPGVAQPLNGQERRPRKS